MRSTPGRPGSLYNEQVPSGTAHGLPKREGGRTEAAGLHGEPAALTCGACPWPRRQVTGTAASQKAAHPRLGDAGRQAEGMPPGVKADGPGGPLSASDPTMAVPLSAKGQKAPTQS